MAAGNAPPASLLPDAKEHMTGHPWSLFALLAIFALGLRSAFGIDPEPADYFETEVRPVLMETCGDCHHPDDDSHHVRFLDATSADDMNHARSLWSNAAEQLRNRTMPPADSTQPSEEDRLRIAAWIESRLAATACQAGEQALPVTTRRLNRTEYDNTVRSLVGLDLKLSEKFPADGSGGEGFDNNGETLFLPPLLMERYLEAAESIVNAAIIAPPSSSLARPSEMLPELADGQDGGTTRPLPRGKKLSHPFVVYSAGDYYIGARLPKDFQGPADARLELQIDGVVAKRIRPKDFVDGDDYQRAHAQVRLQRGVHVLTVRNATPKSVKEAVTFEIAGLGHVEKRGDIAKARRNAHRALLGVEVGTQPESDEAQRKQARTALTRFMRRAYRRPPRPDEVTTMMSLYRRAAERGDPWEECVKLAFKAVLVSPHFLFRIEQPASPGTTEPLTGHELATRLSYFLWASSPDGELLQLAESGDLQKDDVLLTQAERLLAAPQSKVFAEEFVGQWLGTRDVAGRVAPDTGKFKGQFSTELLLDMRQEPVETFHHVVQNNAPLLDLIDPEYAVINARLAKHYGLMGKKGEKIEYGWPWSSTPKKGSGGPFQVVKLPDKSRGGVLGMGGVHLLTSYPTRTSAVLRGGWVLETLLGVRVPAPPPDVPELKKPKKGKQSEREILAAHREAATCAACHNLMDPVGFALDNFDVLGRWREKSFDFDVDASGVLPSGESFDGPGGLKQVLVAKKDQFYRHLAGKMLGFALGRSLEDADDCTTSRIVESLEERGGRSRSLIEAIVLSRAFRFKASPAEDAVAALDRVDSHGSVTVAKKETP